MQIDQHYTDPRLVAIYDIENATRDDQDFYIRLAADLGTRTIVDLGCGTGALARKLAIDGRVVIGVDPAPAMLAYARRQPGAERVRWVEGDASVLGRPDADLIVMTGNVAQVFLDDAEWAATLRAIHAALRPGGHLAFESRNPEARAWEVWNKEATHERIDSPNGPMECWLELKRVGDGTVSFEGHNVFNATGELMVVGSTLRFRSYDELTDSLVKSGFVIERVYGDWNRGLFTHTSRLMAFVARRD